MTGEQLYDGWVRAVNKVAPNKAVLSWHHMYFIHQSVWNKVAEDVNQMGPPDARGFVAAFGRYASPDPMVTQIAEELCTNWSGYFDMTSIGEASSEHAEGDVWLFKASGIKAKVQAVSGTQVILKINGANTGWIEVEELAKDAKKV